MSQAAGSFTRRLGVAEGTPLRRPIVEFSYKRDDLGDPLLTRSHIDVLDLAPADESGITAVWLNRLDETGDPPRAAELPDLERLPETLESLLPDADGSG